MKKLTYLMIHCTATPEGREITSQMIHEWHTTPPPNGRGWKQVGYSDLVHLNGNVENLVPYNEDNIVEAWEITNGHAGVNSITRHIVYAGGMDKDMKHPKDTRTKEQILALSNYVKHVIAQHPNIIVCGHNQFSEKACPSFDVPAFLKSLGIAEKNIYTK